MKKDDVRSPSAVCPRQTISGELPIARSKGVLDSEGATSAQIFRRFWSSDLNCMRKLASFARCRSWCFRASTCSEGSSPERLIESWRTRQQR